MEAGGEDVMFPENLKLLVGVLLTCFGSWRETEDRD